MVLVDGSLAAYVERGGKSVVTFGVDAEQWAPALFAAVRNGRLGDLEVARIDGAAIGESDATDALLAAGFTRGYKGLVARVDRRAASTV